MELATALDRVGTLPLSTSMRSGGIGKWLKGLFHHSLLADKFCSLDTPSCVLMQPSMANLNSPSSRVVKDSTPFRCQILRCINFGNGEFSPSLFLNVVNLYLIKFKKMNLEQTCVLLLFCLFESES